MTGPTPRKREDGSLIALIWDGDGAIPIEAAALEQIDMCANMPFVRPYVAVMPDCHAGHGSTIGSVIPMKGAVIPSVVGVDIGCGILAHKVTKNYRGYVNIESLESLERLRSDIESKIPNGRTSGVDTGAHLRISKHIQEAWDSEFSEEYEELCTKYPAMRSRNTIRQLGTLGTGNHFIELCLDENKDLWVMLHSGSRGMGNKIGSFFSKLALEFCEKWFITLPDKDLAYLPLESEEGQDYLLAAKLAQAYAVRNRALMLSEIEYLLGTTFPAAKDIYSCIHNYITYEHHFGENFLVARKGAIRARVGDVGIIPGSMGTKSYIVTGKGNTESLHSCSHGAGRAMSRTKALATFTIADHVEATKGVVCYKGDEVLDETPGAYKDIDTVMAAQTDLVEVKHTLKQLLCVKGKS